MQKYWKKSLTVALVALLISSLVIGAGEFLTFEVMKQNSQALSRYVHAHYLASLLVFACCFVATSFLLPGALGLTIMGGFLFGSVPGGLYSCFFSTAASTLAFLVSRHFIGERIQDRYKQQMQRFNSEIDRYGSNYLFVMRIMPILPAFLVNYLSGITHISTLRFAGVSFLGILPGALIYAGAGGQLARIEHPQDIMSAGIAAGFSLLAAAALVPVVSSRVSGWLRRRRDRPS